MSEATHLPAPWSYKDSGNGSFEVITDLPIKWEDRWSVNHDTTEQGICSLNKFIQIHTVGTGEERQDIAGANAKRIVECVNAFEGIENPSNFMEVVKSLELDAFQKMKQERDELRTAFGELADMLITIKRSCEIEDGLGNQMQARQIGELLSKYIP